jgi:hypothetical protein
MAKCLAFEGHWEAKIVISAASINDACYHVLVKYGAELREILEMVKFNDGCRRKYLFNVRSDDEL